MPPLPPAAPIALEAMAVLYLPLAPLNGRHGLDACVEHDLLCTGTVGAVSRNSDSNLSIVQLVQDRGLPRHCNPPPNAGPARSGHYKEMEPYMKAVRLALLLSIILASSPFVGSAWAIGGMDSFRYFYSDQQMTQIIGWMHHGCNGGSSHHGICDDGDPAWDDYVSTHMVYERDEETTCDTIDSDISCWVWYGDNESYMVCPF